MVLTIDSALQLSCASDGIDFAEAKSEIEAGRLVQLCSKRSQGIQGFVPALIGSIAKKKVTALIGLEADDNNPETILKELDCILEARPDFIMDLTTSGAGNNIRAALKKELNLPLGCGLTYDIFRNFHQRVSCAQILETVEAALETGIDLALLHFGVNWQLINLADRSDRIMKTTSRGGGLVIAYMKYHSVENPLLELFTDIVSLCKKYSAVLDLGDIFRSGSLSDAGDNLKLHELYLLSELRQRARDDGIQVLCETGGHIPLSRIPTLL